MRLPDPSRQIHSSAGFFFLTQGNLCRGTHTILLLRDVTSLSSHRMRIRILFAFIAFFQASPSSYVNLRGYPEASASRFSCQNKMTFETHYSPAQVANGFADSLFIPPMLRGGRVVCDPPEELSHSPAISETGYETTPSPLLSEQDHDVSISSSVQHQALRTCQKCGSNRVVRGVHDEERKWQSFLCRRSSCVLFDQLP